MIFCDGRNFRANSVHRTFKCVATVNVFDHGCTSLVFLRSAMVVYSCDIHKVSRLSRLLTGKKGQLKKEVPSIAMMTNFGIWPFRCVARCLKCQISCQNKGLIQLSQSHHVPAKFKHVTLKLVRYIFCTMYYHAVIMVIISRYEKLPCKHGGK